MNLPLSYSLIPVPRPLCITLTLLMALLIFSLDYFTHFDMAMATLYVIVVAMAANFASRLGLIAIIFGCLGLAWLGFMLGSGNPLHFVISLVAIIATGLLVGRSRNALRELERQASLLELTHDAIFVRGLDDKIQYWNSGAEELYGFGRQQAQGRVSHELLNTGAEQSVAPITNQLMRTGRWKGELIQQRADGAWLTVSSRWALLRDSRGRPLAILESNNDITERKKAEASLKEQERSKRVALATIPALVWISRPDMSLDYVNAHWQAQGVGESAKTLGWCQLLHPDDTAQWDAKWQLAWQSQKQGLEVEARLRLNDGSYRWFLHRALPIYGDDGEVARWYGTSIDIQERKSAQEALIKAQAELAHTSRVLSLGELAASIAHEVNQPITTVVTHGEALQLWLRRPELATEEIKAGVAAMVAEGRRAGEIIRRLRDMARNSQAQHGPLQCAALAEEVLAMVRHELERKKVRLSLEASSSLPQIAGDRVQLQQVLLNLILNAIQAMAQVPEEARHLRLDISESGQSLTFSVTDSGMGIPPGQHQQLFNAFYTTREEGMGMGLSICRSIIEAHDGQIWAETPASGGARFSFTLPVAADTALVADHAPL
ncbi:ATP-binding protein [Gallaecimonas pentaromativorans]|uniref:ATP-binding protein n=1 Tax=Gallaecimonas pentaromativorans TaxID=584787 RepID=UPI003A924BB8